MNLYSAKTLEEYSKGSAIHQVRNPLKSCYAAVKKKQKLKFENSKVIKIKHHDRSNKWTAFSKGNTISCFSKVARLQVVRMVYNGSEFPKIPSFSVYGILARNHMNRWEYRNICGAQFSRYLLSARSVIG